MDISIPLKLLNIAIWQSGILRAATCHHMRAVEYFTESIRQECLFQAFPCSSWEEFKKGKCFKQFSIDDMSPMGMPARLQANKKKQPLYLTTLSKSPYCGT